MDKLTKKAEEKDTESGKEESKLELMKQAFKGQSYANWPSVLIQMDDAEYQVAIGRLKEMCKLSGVNDILRETVKAQATWSRKPEDGAYTRKPENKRPIAKYLCVFFVGLTIYTLIAALIHSTLIAPTPLGLETLASLEFVGAELAKVSAEDLTFLGLMVTAIMVIWWFTRPSKVAY